MGVDQLLQLDAKRNDQATQLGSTWEGRLVEVVSTRVVSLRSSRGNSWSGVWDVLLIYWALLLGNVLEWHPKGHRLVACACARLRCAFDSGTNSRSSASWSPTFRAARSQEASSAAENAPPSHSSTCCQKNLLLVGRLRYFLGLLQ